MANQASIMPPKIVHFINKAVKTWHNMSLLLPFFANYFLNHQTRLSSPILRRRNSNWRKCSTFQDLHWIFSGTFIFFCRFLLLVCEEAKCIYVKQNRDIQIFQNFSNHLKILGARRVTWSEDHAEHPQILAASIQNLVAAATWPLGFLHLCFCCMWGIVCCAEVWFEMFSGNVHWLIII